MYSNHISLNNDTYNVFFYSNLRMFLTCSQLDSDHMDLLAALTLPHACTRVQRGGLSRRFGLCWTVFASVCGQTAAVWNLVVVMKAGRQGKRWRGGQVDHRAACAHTQTHTPSHRYAFIATPCWLRGQCKFCHGWIITLRVHRSSYTSMFFVSIFSLISDTRADLRHIISSE